LGASNPAVSELARRYGTALFELAKEKASLERVRAGLKAFGEAVKASPELAHFLQVPLYRLQDKSRALSALARQIGADPLVVNFVGTMALNARSADIPAAGIAFEELYMRQRGLQRAVVRTPAVLTPAQRERLNALLAKSVGGDVEITEEIDPTLVGGIQLRLGSRLYDASLRTKLEHLNMAMKGA
jgi:F-type H+-transporting ATPase subunit delta